MVAIPVSIAFIAFAFKWWGAVPLKNDPSFRVMSPTLEKYILWMHLPLLALFWVAVTRRLVDYGMTQPRYYLILLGPFYSCIIGLELKKRLTGRWCSVLFLITVILSFFQVGT